MPHHACIGSEVSTERGSKVDRPCVGGAHSSQVLSTSVLVRIRVTVAFVFWQWPEGVTVQLVRNVVRLPGTELSTKLFSNVLSGHVSMIIIGIHSVFFFVLLL